MDGVEMCHVIYVLTMKIRD